MTTRAVSRARLAYTFRVDGRPTVQGSKIRTRWGMREAGGDNLVLWREAVRSEAVQARGDNQPLTGPLVVSLNFRLPAPKSRPKRRRTWPIGKNAGDIDKLSRAVLDGLVMGQLIEDDGMVVQLLALKDYPGEGTVPGVTVWVETVEESPAPLHRPAFDHEGRCVCGHDTFHIGSKRRCLQCLECESEDQ